MKEIAPALIAILEPVVDWLLTNATPLGFLAAIGWLIWKYMSWLNGKFEAMDRKFSDKFVAIDIRFEKIDARFDLIDLRFTTMDAKFEGKYETLKEDLQKLETRIRYDIQQMDARINAILGNK